MLRRFIVTWFFNIVALWVAAEIIDGIGYSGNEWVMVVAALVFSVVNIFVKPFVILFTLPLVILTLGLALFFVNLLMLYLTSWIVDDFKVESFGAAILATIIVWIVEHGARGGVRPGRALSRALPRLTARPRACRYPAPR